MSHFGARSTKRFGIRQAPARVWVRASTNLLASIKARSEGPARSAGATPLITCDIEAASLACAPVSAVMSAIVKPDGRSKKRRFPIYQYINNETGFDICGSRVRGQSGSECQIRKL